MKLRIVTKNVEISAAIREQTEKKIGKLSHYLPSIGEGKVEILKENARLPQQRFSVQVTLDIKGVLIRAQEKAEDVRTAIDRVVEALANRIERYKSKLYDKGRGISLARQGITEETEYAETSKKIVKNKRFLIKSMSQDEAINQMELLGHDFFLFVDSETGKFNLLYCRKDGNYGLIETGVG
ncbi:MAG: ribosome-associated translation inhibitor RaiA [Dehalococcoidia bacterium]|nr:ribosome-associated translation inhibitor RaiA [Dehalococcoidia bacterium]